ncbi:hypothetical protein BH23ACT1_BH23ACT1_09780 [soil metagenome]
MEDRQAGGSRREVDLLDILRAAGVTLPLQQYELIVGCRRRIIDYAYPKVGLEFDGFSPGQAAVGRARLKSEPLVVVDSETPGRSERQPDRW